MARKKQPRKKKPAAIAQNKHKKPDKLSLDLVDSVTAGIAIIGAVLASAFGADGMHTAMVSCVFLTICVVLFDIFRHLLITKRWYYFLLLVLASFIACGIWEIRNRHRAISTSDTVAKVNTPDEHKDDIKPASEPVQPQTTNENQNQSRHKENSTVAQKGKTAHSNENKAASKDVFVLSSDGVPILFSDVQIENRMTGAVTDLDTDVGIKGATITIQNIKTGIEYKTESENDGSFLRSLPFGDYKVIISYPGYHSESRQCIIRKEHGCFVDFNHLRKVSLNRNSN